MRSLRATELTAAKKRIAASVKSHMELLACAVRPHSVTHAAGNRQPAGQSCVRAWASERTVFMKR